MVCVKFTYVMSFGTATTADTLTRWVWSGEAVLVRGRTGSICRVMLMRHAHALGHKVGHILYGNCRRSFIAESSGLHLRPS